jgi:hypothetical protein
MRYPHKSMTEPLTCLRCGNEWTPRKPSPKKCPGCQNPGWSTPRTRKRKVVMPNGPIPIPQCEVAGESASAETPTPEPVDRIKQARERAEKLLEQISG